MPQWQHSGWDHYGLRTLADYTHHFNSVEGNTTLYALPDTERVREWRAMTRETFRFCFKFPATIYQPPGRAAPLPVAAGGVFRHPRAALVYRIGQYCLQLTADFHYGVEVRHPAFFTKQDEERALNRGL